MFRRDAESLMVDTVTIRAESTTGSMDPETGEHTSTPGAVRYQGKGKFQDRQVQERGAESGAHEFITVRQEVHIPVGVKVLEGDVVTWDASPNDPSNVGRVFRVAAPQGKSWSTAQRVPVDEIVG